MSLITVNVSEHRFMTTYQDFRLEDIFTLPLFRLINSRLSTVGFTGYESRVDRSETVDLVYYRGFTLRVFMYVKGCYRFG